MGNFKVISLCAHGGTLDVLVDPGAHNMRTLDEISFMARIPAVTNALKPLAIGKLSP